MVQECYDLWQTSIKMTRLGRIASLAIKALYEIIRSYACDFASLSPADREIVYKWAKQAVAKMKSEKPAVITFDAALDDAVARALTDTLCASDLDAASVCVPVQSSRALSPTEDGAVRQVLSLVRLSHEMFAAWGPAIVCPLPSKQQLINALVVHFPSTEWLASEMRSTRECRPLVRSVARQWALDLREHTIIGPRMSNAGAGEAENFRVATGMLMYLVWDSRFGRKIDGLLELLADIVCDTTTAFDGTTPADVRTFMLSTVADILVEGCANLPPLPQEYRQNSDAFPVQALSGTMIPAPVQTVRSILGSSL